MTTVASMLERTKHFCLEPINLLFLLVIVLSAFLRLWNITNTPLWFVDEGTNMNIAWNLVNGKLQMFTTTYPFVPHPPLFYGVLALALKALGYTMTVARSLNAFFGILTTICVFFAGKELLNKKVGLIASFLFAIFPLAIDFNRMNFDYNLLQLLSVFALLACLKYLKTKKNKWLYGAAIIIGAATITNPIGIGLAIGLIAVIFINKNIKLTLKSLLVTLGVFASYPISMMILIAKDFQNDVSRYFFAHAIVKVGGDSGTSVFANATSIISYSPWIALGLLGLLMYPLFFKKKQESIILAGFFVGLFIFTSVFFNAVVTRGITQLFPFFAIGIAIGIWGISHAYVSIARVPIEKRLNKTKLAKPLVFSLWLSISLLVALPLSLVVYSDFESLSSGFSNINDNYCTQSPIDAADVANYLDKHTTPDEFSIVPSMIAWLIHGNSTALPYSAAMDYRTELRPTYTDDRFTFNCSFKNAKFMVTDNFVKNHLIDQEPAYDLIVSNVMTNWTQVYTIGEYNVFLNPAFGSKDQGGL